MKQLIIITILLMHAAIFHAQTWDTIFKRNPIYSYALPGSVNQQDTLNFRLSYSFLNSTLYKVVEFIDTPLDSTDMSFIKALSETEGDTLLAVAHNISSGSGIPIISTSSITTFSTYKGLEVTMKYTDPGTGKVLWVYNRLFLSAHSFITFSVTGEEDHLTSLQASRDLFFNSISLQ